MQSIKSSEKKSSKSKYRKRDNRREMKSVHQTQKNQQQQTQTEICKSNINSIQIGEKTNNDDENATKTTTALMTDGIQEKTSGSNKIVLTEAQKQNVERILEKLFSKNSSFLASNSAAGDDEIPNNNNNAKNLPSQLLHTIISSNDKKIVSEKKVENHNGSDATKSDDDDDDDENEYVEYVFKPRQYFSFSMCQLCKRKLKEVALPCRKCFMTYYCCIQHMADDKQHQGICAAFKELAEVQGGHIFNGTNNLSGDLYRNFRVQMLKRCEDILQRDLELYEKEIILYPKVCCKETCREWRYAFLTQCKKCGQVAFCKNDPNHLDTNHNLWCSSFSIMAQLIRLQAVYGNIEPDMPTEILRSSLKCDMSMVNVLDVLYKNNEIKDDLSFANTTQVATAPLTAWYGMRMFEAFQKPILNVHVIGAEFHFEANQIQKWEYFFLHLTPTLKELNIIFIGPELAIPGVPFDLLSKSRMCKNCRTENRRVNFKFENSLYHDYYETAASFVEPHLICYFNPGLHRFTGFDNIDTWAETIRISAMLKKCPIIVTSYTEYESPLDLKRFVLEAQRPIDIIVPPIQNPFSSTKPERNFISDEKVPLMYKNFYCFIVQ